MSLRSSDDRPAKGRLDLSMPPELREYVALVHSKGTRKRDGSKKSESDIVCEAVELDRDLALLLKPEEKALVDWAKAHGLNLADDLAAVLGQLVIIGLRTSAEYEKTKEGAEAERRRGERRSIDRRT